MNAAPADADDHGRRRFGRLGLEHLATRHDDMDAGGVDAAIGQDGARKFAFQRTLFIEILLELGLAQHRLVVEDLIADRAGGHETLGRRQHARRADLVAVDHDGRAVASTGVFDPGLVQGLGDLAGLLEIEVGIEQRVRRLADTQHHGHQHRRHAGGDAQHHGQPTDPKPLQRR